MNGEAKTKTWAREEIENSFNEILVDALSVGVEKVVPEASLVYDLGVESIDFLDIGFRVQQTFGVEVPNGAIQQKILRWRSMGELQRILADWYGGPLPGDEMNKLQDKGVRGVLRWLAEKRGVDLEDGYAEKVAGELADRLAEEVESLGFRASLVDRQGVIKVLLDDLNSPKIAEAMLRVLTVGALVDFIAGRVGARSVDNG